MCLDIICYVLEVIGILLSSSQTVSKDEIKSWKWLDWRSECHSIHKEGDQLELLYVVNWVKWQRQAAVPNKMRCHIFNNNNNNNNKWNWAHEIKECSTDHKSNRSWMPSVELSMEKLKSSFWRGGDKCSNMAMSTGSKWSMRPSKSLSTSAAELSEISRSLLPPGPSICGYAELLGWATSPVLSTHASCLPVSSVVHEVVWWWWTSPEEAWQCWGWWAGWGRWPPGLRPCWSGNTNPCIRLWLGWSNTEP